MSAVPAILLFGLGLVVGSFLNVCIYRLPRRESVSWPGSHCTSCNRSLSWYENIPLGSWVVLGGRCRTCRARISAVYPIIEAMTLFASKEFEASAPIEVVSRFLLLP